MVGEYYCKIVGFNIDKVTQIHMFLKEKIMEDIDFLLWSEGLKQSLDQVDTALSRGE